MTTSGPVLRAERRAAEITATETAARMRISRATLYTLEKSAVVTTDRAVQYRAALADAIEASRARVA